VAGGGELAHVQPELGDDDLGGLGADAGDLVQALHRRQRALGWISSANGGPGVGPTGGCLGGGERRDRLLDQGGELIELRGQPVDLVQQDPGQTGVVVAELAGERLDQRRPFDA
jgi:hypothetical protein